MKNTKPQWISSVKFIAFDLDGTLFRQVPETWNAIQDQICDLVMERRHLSHHEAKEYVAKRYQELGSSTKLLNELGVSGEDFFTEAYLKLDFSTFIKKDERLELLLQKLSKQYRLGIVSNTHRTSADSKLGALGITTALFDPFITTYELDVLKPDPTPFLKALELARVSPEESVYVGDSELNDIEGARAVGMRTIKVWGAQGEPTAADLSLETIYELGRVFLGDEKL